MLLGTPLTLATLSTLAYRTSAYIESKQYFSSLCCSVALLASSHSLRSPTFTVATTADHRMTKQVGNDGAHRAESLESDFSMVTLVLLDHALPVESSANPHAPLRQIHAVTPQSPPRRFPLAPSKHFHASKSEV